MQDGQDGDAGSDAGDDETAPASQPTSSRDHAAARPLPLGSEDAAFDAFFAQHERALYGYLRRMLPTHEAALDVAQEAFFRAWRHFETVRGYDRPQAWLFRVATNLALDTFRRRQPTGLARIFSERSADIPDEGDPSEIIPALTDPFDMERSLAARDLVNRALARLPERQRAAVLLWAAHGLTCAEIAAALETTEVNVRQMLSRGRARFREVYEQLQQD
jgi:RNA polymerase sigma-70 factor, ECF subfamily